MPEVRSATAPVIDPRRIPIWVIYDHPTDFPDHFVARMHHSLPWPEPTELVMVSPNLEALRLYYAGCGFTLLPREECDDPVIVESWLS